MGEARSRVDRPRTHELGHQPYAAWCAPAHGMGRSDDHVQDSQRRSFRRMAARKAAPAPRGRRRDRHGQPASTSRPESRRVLQGTRHPRRVPASVFPRLQSHRARLGPPETICPPPRPASPNRTPTYRSTRSLPRHRKARMQLVRSRRIPGSTQVISGVKEEGRRGRCEPPASDCSRWIQSAGRRLSASADLEAGRCDSCVVSRAPRVRQGRCRTGASRCELSRFSRQSNVNHWKLRVARYRAPLAGTIGV